MTFLYSANTWGILYFDFRLLELRGGPQDSLPVLQLASKAAVFLCLRYFWDRCLSFKHSHQLS